MAVSFPRIRLFEEDGTTLVYEFEFVTNIEDNQDPANFIEHQALRGQGSIISEGSDSAWNLPMDFVLQGDDYEDITSQIDTLKSAVVKFTKYILKVEKTSGGATQDYKIMRLESFLFPLGNRRKRVNIQRVQSIFRVDCWA